jgi:hypothetical protein
MMVLGQGGDPRTLGQPPNGGRVRESDREDRSAAVAFVQKVPLMPAYESLLYEQVPLMRSAAKGRLVLCAVHRLPFPSLPIPLGPGTPEGSGIS